MCLNFQCGLNKREKKKLEAEVIKVIVKPTLKEVWGAESLVPFLYFLEFSFCCFLSSDFKGFSKGR